MKSFAGYPFLVGLLFISGCMAEIDPDLDGDGVSDSEDWDADGDGWNNSDEEMCGNDPMDSLSIPTDIDLDGVCDNLDDDMDGDGLPNGWESERGFDPMDSEDFLSCHGKSIFCLTRYDSFIFPQTHNSFATSDAQFALAVSHLTGLEEQWGGGIRAFMLDTHHRNEVNTTPEDVRLCHDTGVLWPCALGEDDAEEWLRTLKYLMDNATGDVVTLKFESYVPSPHLEYLFNITGLKERAYSHVLGEPWPSIGDLVLQGKNLVVFQQSHNDDYPWLHGSWSHTWETKYEMEEENDMNCRVDRGDGDQTVWVLNHFFKNEFGTPDPSKSIWANDYHTIINRTLECWEEVGNKPTLFAIDFWEEGELVNATISLNQMSHWTDEVPERS